MPVLAILPCKGIFWPVGHSRGTRRASLWHPLFSVVFRHFPMQRPKEGLRVPLPLLFNRFWGILPRKRRKEGIPVLFPFLFNCFLCIVPCKGHKAGLSVPGHFAMQRAQRGPPCGPFIFQMLFGHFGHAKRHKEGAAVPHPFMFQWLFVHCAMQRAQRGPPCAPSLYLSMLFWALRHAKGTRRASLCPFLYFLIAFEALCHASDTKRASLWLSFIFQWLVGHVAMQRHKEGLSVTPLVFHCFCMHFAMQRDTNNASQWIPFIF